MLKQTTIDAVNDLPLEQVIGKYIELKKSGSGFVGKSPFTEEKTPSFHISPSKGFWKCFSTGKGGNSPIKFVMEMDMCTYPEAITKIADDNGVLIEYDDGESGRKNLEKAYKIREINDLNMMAMSYYESNRDKTPADIRKRTCLEMEEKFGIGYAIDTWDSLTKYLLNEGVSYDLMIKSGLTVKGKKGYYDFFRGRVMFPLFNHTGKIIGFSGRDAIYSNDKERKEKGCPKVLNSKENDVFSKSNCLLGLFQAKHDMAKMGFACVVEGNHDVTSMHNAGMTNTVASLGTAFTEEHVQLLKKYTDTILFFADNDKAGKKKIHQNIEVVLKEGLKAFVFLPDEDGADPDDFINGFEGDNVADYIKERQTDGVEFLTDLFFKDAETPIKKAEAEQSLIKLLSIIKNSFLRNAYVKKFAKEYGISKAEVEKAVTLEISTKARSAEEDAPKGLQLPSHIKGEGENDWKHFGFYHETQRDKIGYWFPTGSSFEQVSNFIIKPLFQIKAVQDSKRIVEIENRYGKQIIIIPNKAFVGPQQFEEIVINEGKFWFDGSKKQFQKLRRKLLDQFRTAIEIRTLGWQNDGFFSFSDGIVDGSFKKVDSNGLCQFNDQDYFLPAFSKIYNELQEEDDIYKKDRDFSFKPGKITMAQWAEMMVVVHGENGEWSVLYMISSLFRDHIFDCLTYFPHLFNFGQVQTGKSACSRAVNAIFFGNQTPFNLSQGTPVGFSRRMARTKNTPAWFDEYRNDIDQKRFDQLKGSYDGSGHERGTLSRDNRTETTSVNVAPIVSGQYLPTRDDNSYMTRCIIREFTVKTEDRTQEDSKAFQELTKLQDQGLSHLIIEVIKYRELIVEQFRSTVFEIQSNLKRSIPSEQNKGRIMENYALVLACHKLLGEKLKLPFTYDEMYEKAVKSILWQSELVIDSDAMGGYWKMIEFMSMQHMIKNGEDYKVVAETSVTVREGRKESKVVTFNSPREILYVRLTKIHPLYMETHRKQFGENGVPEQSIKSYMKSSKAFIGNIGTCNFDGTKTSAFAFDFERLGIALKGHNDSKPKEEEKPTDDLPF